MADDAPDILTLTAEITASYLGNASHVKGEDIPALIRTIRAALSEGGPAASTPEAAPSEPSPRMHGATVKKSITPDALISFIDNKPYKTLKRHLARHGHDMKSYREAYGLPKDYPSVAPAYSAARSEMAKKIGLGARGRNAGASASAEAADSKAPAARGRKKAAADAE